ncbi:MAG: plasmid pRiA4b ORF-3 family protein [Lentisphaerae bacterium]|nr:plasmid pRiA4b ORF-3 family protein [Lentisphaerota bacterium]
MARKSAPKNSKTVKRPRMPDAGDARLQAPGRLFQIHVSLLGCRPGIWRSLVLPGEADLGMLHRALQAALDWSGTRGHYFVAGNMKYSDSKADIERSEAIDESCVHLCEVAPRERDSFTYLYDPGSDWECEILVEKISGRGEKFPGYPVCLDGESACPPEDCGGIEGYESMLNAMNEPDAGDDDDPAGWEQDAFDPEAFDLEEINRRLRNVK